MGHMILNSFIFTPPIALSYVTTVSSTTNSSSYTFTAASIGDAATDRLVIVTIGGTTGASRSVSSVTIGGISATQAVSANTSWALVDAIWYAAVPTGTTGDIVVTFSGSMAQCVVSVFRLTGQTSNTPAATGSDTTGSTSVDPNCNVTTGDVVVAFCVGGDGSAIAWTGATEQSDTVVEGMCFSSAMYTAVSSETPHAINAAITGGSASSATSAAWR